MSNAPESEHTTLYNPESGDAWGCPNGAVDHFLAKGWTKTPKPAAPAAPANKPKDVN